MKRENIDENEISVERYQKISEKKINLFSKQDLIRFILDFSYSVDDRIKGIERIISEYLDDSKDVLYQLCVIYFHSCNTDARDTLIEVTKINIDPYLRFEIAKSLCGENEEINLDNIFIKKEDIILGYEIFEGLCKQFIKSKDITPNCKFDYLYFLANNKEYYDRSCFYFKIMIDDNSLEIDYRYKAILSLELKIKDKDIRLRYLKDILSYFQSSINNPHRYRILSSQYLLSLENNEKIESYLLSVANDETIDYNVRADATDVVLAFGSPKNKEIARDIIIYLGGILGRAPINIFDNAQNVHSQEIEKSSLEILEMLNHKIKINYDFPFIDAFIRKEIKEKLKKDDISKIEITLNRISNDRALYGKYYNNLKSILSKVFNFIFEQKELKEEYLKRLYEELIDISGTCSTGAANRLINVLSGISDYSIRISWEDQLISNFDGRLRARIKNNCNQETAENILIEMMSSNYSERTEFLKFYRSHLSSLRQELYEEFKEYISDTDFDLYFYKAMLRYEGSD